MTSLERAVEAIGKIRAKAAEGRKTPGGRVRVGDYWYGEAGEESVIVFRQGTRTQLKALEGFEGSPPAERAKANKKTVADCVLWFDGITPESKAEDFVAFVDALEEDLYPIIWGEIITRWDEHNHSARHDLRGKA